ncbi:hypothetical protein [Lysobacter solisilvae (ex Woo and Kim 2020)]|uniref:DUF2007 domain-containing protein n=1 Tax=Agrilutibacter terrestris TaxID=2865112 RepID=A0A7H0FVN9_9GAMM|nr:hypothetical protein [Lysobacter terrestris]QNP40105.1 hypothetical protein H8B22_11460 [Lysobacter terrestris]
MRQVFSSLRLENVEAVAKLLREAGIQVRITNGRSYKGAMRSRASYSDQSTAKPAVWVVHSEDHSRARDILRDNGLLESTRATDSFLPPSFRMAEEAAAAKSPAQQRTFRFKLILLGGIVLVIVLAMLRGCHAPRQAANTAPAAPVVSDQPARAGGTPQSLALAVFAKEVATAKFVLCLSIDDADASGAVIAAMKQPSNQVVPMSQCVREFDPERGSYQAATGQPALLVTVRNFKPTGADTGTVEFEAFHHGQFAHYKTLEVKRVGGAWQVTKVLRHVASFGMGE